MSHPKEPSLTQELYQEKLKRLEARARTSEVLLSAIHFLASPSFPDSKTNLLCTYAKNAVCNGRVVVIVCTDTESFTEAIIYSHLSEMAGQTFPTLVVSSEFPKQLAQQGVNGYHQLYQMLTHVVVLLQGLDPRQRQDLDVLRSESGRFYRAYFTAHPDQTPTPLDKEIMSF